MKVNVVDIVDVSYSYGRQEVLEGVNFCLREGELVALVGPNGAGKTTLLRLILGLAAPSRGSVYVWGCNPYEDPSVRGRIGYLPQRTTYETYLPLNVADAVFLALPGRPFGFRPHTIEKARIREAVALVGMEEYLYSPLNALSGGQQQLVFLARALVRNPRLLLLDEPTNTLDLAAQHRFYELLAQLRHKLALTVLVVSHDVLPLAQVADRFILLHQGTAVSGSPREILGRLLGQIPGTARVQQGEVGR